MMTNHEKTFWKLLTVLVFGSCLVMAVVPFTVVAVKNKPKGESQMSECIKPVADRILVKPDEAQEMSEGGILLPDQAKKVPGKGMVLAVGIGVKEVKVGDVAIYNKYDATVIELEGREFVVIEEKKVQMRITGEKK